MRYTAFLFSILSFGAFGQNCDRVLFSGEVEDSLIPQNFYNLMIVNKTSGRGAFGRPNGSFSVYASAGDTIAISVTEYEPKLIIIQPDSNCQMNLHIFIDQKPQEIAEVVVYPLKSLEQIKEEREALAMRETRLVTGINVLESPITALYQAFSKKERTKRWIAEQEFKDDQARVVKELLRTYVAYDIIELSAEEFDEFVAFLNIDENFLKTASEMELITFIQDKFKHYVLLKDS